MCLQCNLQNSSTVIRGTPTVVQLLIAYFIVFTTSNNDVQIAVFALELTQAYVAEIIRAGIMAVPEGQFEAGRSLGFNYLQTMFHIIIPQMVKNVLPALVMSSLCL